jgi:hypothetical protein
MPKLTLLILLFTFLLVSCAKYKKVDSRKVPQNAQERARKNVEEGRGISVKGLLGKNKGGAIFEFSRSNPMWRASLDTLNFLPLSNVDYSGGIIITDWYSDSLENNDSIKITLQFLSNEIRSDSLKISVYKKNCNVNNACKVNLSQSKIKEELLETILTKAAQLQIADKTKK